MFFHPKNLKSENNNPWVKPWFNILLHKQSIVIVFRVLGIHNIDNNMNVLIIPSESGNAEK